MRPALIPTSSPTPRLALTAALAAGLALFFAALSPKANAGLTSDGSGAASASPTGPTRNDGAGAQAGANARARAKKRLRFLGLPPVGLRGPIEGRVLAIGDSLLVGLERPLRQAFAAREEGPIDVAVIARTATGLSRPDYFDWQRTVELASKDREFLAAFVVLGVNDAQPIREGRTFKPFGSAEWIASYSARVRSIVTALCRSTQEVYWLRPPPMRNAKFQGRMALLTKTIESSLGECAKMIDSPSVLAGAKGEFVARKKIEGRSIALRASDGIHMSKGGARLVAAWMREGYDEGF